KRVKAFIESYKDKKVVLLGINSSSGDTENGLKSYAKDQKLTFPILRDADQTIAQYFSISQTSMFLVIDTKGKLRYSGGFDDNVNMNMVRRQYVKKAVDSILANKRFLLRKTFSFG
ncbi:MAG: redoxin domain-containing protein, partial [Planctomycetota bacterium]|nr:redoxin domain-containing protein [Planctomycetota bacterium]